MAVQYRHKVDLFPSERLEAIARVLADTDRGLNGSQIGQIILEIGIEDPSPTLTKWKRLFHAFAEFQNKHQIGNHVVKFINKAMDPAKYTNSLEAFHWRRDQLNPILAFCGMTLDEGGKVKRAKPAKACPLLCTGVYRSAADTDQVKEW